MRRVIIRSAIPTSAMWLPRSSAISLYRNGRIALSADVIRQAGIYIWRCACVYACVRACVHVCCVRICACRDRNEEAVGRSEWEDERQCRWARGIRREIEEEGERSRERGRERGVALRLVHARTPTSGTHVTRPDRYALPKSPSLFVFLSVLSLFLSLSCFSLSLLLSFSFFLLNSSSSSSFYVFSSLASFFISLLWIHFFSYHAVPKLRFSLSVLSTIVRTLYSFLSHNLAHSSHAHKQLCTTYSDDNYLCYSELRFS